MLSSACGLERKSCHQSSKMARKSFESACCILNVFWDPVPESSENVLSRQNQFESACCILIVFLGPVPEYRQNQKSAIKFILAITKKNIQ
jgi:hypothetical protein